jgi:hypothetical protein
MTDDTNKPVTRQPVFYVALTFGLVLLGFAARGIYRDIRFVSTSATAQGVITRIMKRDTGGRNGLTYLPEFTFTTQDGRVVTLISKSGNNPSSFSAGENVEVLYAAGHPENAKIHSFGQIWTTDCVLAFVGSAYAGLTLFAWRYSRRLAVTSREGS